MWRRTTKVMAFVTYFHVTRIFLQRASKEETKKLLAVGDAKAY